MNKLKLFLIALLTSIYASSYAQQTTMTVDCQTPGWLSNKINYGDQKTLKNLTVTGYINLTDLNFIGSLSSKQSLTGKLDLTNAEIVNIDDDLSGSSSILFGKFTHLYLPISLSPSIKKWNFNATVDTLTIGGNIFHKISSENLWANLGSGLDASSVINFREGTDSICQSAFYHYKNLKKINLPKTLLYLGDYAFYEAKEIEINELPNGLRYIGLKANLGQLKTDKLFLPDSLRYFATTAYYYNYNGNIYDNKTIYIPEKLEIINNTEKYSYSEGAYAPFNNTIFHMKCKTPPYLSYGNLANSTVYVPKGCKDKYLEDAVWSKATIIEEPIHVEHITINQENAKLEIGKKLQLEANVTPIDADNPNIIWKSLDKQIAIVDDKGLVEALNVGNTTIQAISEENSEILAECNITVYQPVANVTLKENSISLNINEEYQLKYSVTPYNANQKVIWTSRNEDIASVDNNGIIKALKPGKTIITASSEENNMIKDQCDVVVNQPVTKITLDQEKVELHHIGEQIQLKATILPEDATNKEIKWTSSNPNVCSISSNGTITALADGTSVVLATTMDGGFVAVCMVIVDSSTGITNVSDITNNTSKYYNLKGEKVTSPQIGELYIVKYNDGTVKKIIYGK